MLTIYGGSGECPSPHQTNASHDHSHPHATIEDEGIITVVWDGFLLPSIHGLTIMQRDGFDHLGLLFGGQLRINWNRDGLLSSLFRFREVPFLITQVTEALL